MKCLRLCLLPALLSLVCLFANGQVNFNSNTLTSQSGFYPSALGSANTANGKYSLVGGTNSTASGECSFGFGNATYATGENSFAFGYQSKALGSSSIAIGGMVEAMFSSSVVIGRHLKATTTGAFVIGAGYDPSQLLINPVSSSLMVGFNSQYPTLFVSNSVFPTSTGKIGIGNITSPTSKLHILADENEAAELRLEHRLTGNHQYSQIYLGTHTIRAGNAENLVFTTPEGKTTVFQTEKMGIGTSEPGAKLQIAGGDVFVEDINSGIIMKSPDGRCWRGTMTNGGTLAFSEIACPVGNGAVGQPDKSAPADVRIYPNPSSNGRFVIECREALTHAMVFVFTSDGRLVAEYELPDTMTLHTGILAAGTYVVSVIEQGRLVKSQQVVVE